MSETVGFVGLGIMGAPMAGHLVAAGLDVVVHNRTREREQALIDQGARAADSPAAVAAQVDTLITMLTDDAAVREVTTSPDGILAGARPGLLAIDMSTIAPATSRELAAAAEPHGVRTLDAPVSGGDVGAREATLSIMVGGAAEDVERARPLLELLGARVTHVGPAGAGQVVKTCNNLLVGITFAGVAEALVLGSKLGVDPAKILDVLSGGMAANRIMEMRRANFLEHDFAPGFKIDLHHKDLNIALASGDEADVPLPLTATVLQMMRQLRAAGHGEEDDSALLRVVEAAAGHRIGPPAS